MSEIIDGKTGEVIDIEEAINSPQAQIAVAVNRSLREKKEAEEAAKNTLEPEEEKRLKLLEAEIANNLKGFMAVGMALMEIRDKRLYRHIGTFEDYCRQVWDMSRIRAHQFIEAKEAVDHLAKLVQKSDHLLTIVNKNNPKEIEKLLPQNEAQVRELLKLKNPEEQISAWQETLEAAAESDSKITASLIKKTIKERSRRALTEIINKGENAINAGEEADKEADKAAEKGKRTNQTRRESKAFKTAWHALMEQIAIEKDANWRNTDRYTIMRILAGIIDHLNENHAPEDRPYGCAMELSDREKLKEADFAIYRMNAKYKLIEKWHREDEWFIYAECESAAALQKTFAELMTMPRALKG